MSLKIPALFALAALGLGAAGCAKPVRPAPQAPAPDPTATARAAFGDHMERYYTKPKADLVRDYGPPTTERPASDGGTIAVWSRDGEAMVEGKPIPQDCDVTAFIDTTGKVAGIVAGGNILFCARSFVPPAPPQVTPPAAFDLYAPPRAGEAPAVPAGGF
ncbi:hypothetical protein [Zavarzinia compransoris]|uniref:Lipoprotein n=1 Tax=Zavarzinia compransoris TaxID=1264899 RepID=A0A317EAB0_9PROT|nr:hypothetical protein [Zavarzinia compransoris]PWR22115.1 hypothetical protein DKG75_09075 [Zavarzinia compransoris]